MQLHVNLSGAGHEPRPGRNDFQINVVVRLRDDISAENICLGVVKYSFGVDSGNSVKWSLLPYCVLLHLCLGAGGRSRQKGRTKTAVFLAGGQRFTLVH